MLCAPQPRMNGKIGRRQSSHS